MMVITRWIITIIPNRMMREWQKRVSKFNPNLDQRERSVRRFGKLEKSEKSPKWICTPQAESTGPISAQSREGSKVRRFV